MSKLSTHNQIIPSRESLAPILAQYGILDFNFLIDPNGVENTTFILTTPQDRYALRVYRQRRRTEEEILLEIDYINYLIDYKIPVPRIIKNQNNQFLTKTKIDSMQWFSVLMEFIEGIHPKYYTKSLLKEFAEIQARMHALAVNFKSDYIITLPKCDTGEKIKDFLFTDLLSVDQIDLSKIKNNNIKNFIGRARKFSFKVDNLPLGIIQKDIHAGNLLTEKNKLKGVLDFDDLFWGPIIASVGFFLWDIFARNGDLQSLHYYVDKYSKFRKLTPKENYILKDMLLLRNYIMGTVEFLTGGDETHQKFLFPMKKYFEMEESLQDFEES